MKDFKGTKGEWKAHLKGRLSSVKASDDEIKIALIIGSEKYYDEDERDPTQESWISFRERTKPLRDKEEKESEANAKLIAAAPELLDAAQEALRMYEKIEPAGGWQHVHDGLKYAINKALEE